MTNFNPARTLVIFGGADPEEAAARRVAEACGAATATATLDGTPVHGGNAYRVDKINHMLACNWCADRPGYDPIYEGNVCPRCDGTAMRTAPKVIIFECSPAAAGDLEVVAICDHHNPGDPGYDLGPADFWRGSSLGQLCELLEVQPTDELLLVAAGDHCPSDAYAGRCPGVDPAVFAEHRIEGKAAFYAANPRTADQADPDAIRAAITAASEKLAAAPLREAGVRDLRDSGFVPELPEAALSTGEAYMASLPDTDRERRPTGNTKIVLGGHTSPEVVRAFMAWAATLEDRVEEPYGNPTRGFAGVVVKG